MAMDMNYWLQRKYAILDQQARSGETVAQATAKNAATNALTGGAAAALDSTRARLLPGESAATVAQTRANTGLINEQAAAVGPESEARIANLRADTAGRNVNTRIAFREGLLPRTTLPGSLGTVMGSQGYTGYTLGSDIAPARDMTGSLPPRRPNESEVSYLDRINP